MLLNVNSVSHRPVFEKHSLQSPVNAVLKVANYSYQQQVTAVIQDF